MKDKQYINVSPDGEIESLRVTKGVDLRNLGKLEVKRITDIRFDDESQKWKVFFLDRECYLTDMDYNLAVYGEANLESASDLLFDTYENAVSAEQAYFYHRMQFIKNPT